MLMSVSSTGKHGEGSGGIYQTPEPTFIANRIEKINPYVNILQDDYPHLKFKPVGMMDAGACMHIKFKEFWLQHCEVTTQSTMDGADLSRVQDV